MQWQLKHTWSGAHFWTTNLMIKWNSWGFWQGKGLLFGILQNDECSECVTITDVIVKNRDWSNENKQAMVLNIKWWNCGVLWWKLWVFNYVVVTSMQENFCFCSNNVRQISCSLSMTKYGSIEYSFMKKDPRWNIKSRFQESNSVTYFVMSGRSLRENQYSMQYNCS